MSNLIKKNNLFFLIILVLFSFFHITNYALAIEVEDDVVRDNTGDIIDLNTEANATLNRIDIDTTTIIEKELIMIEKLVEISERLAGTMPGAQMDNIKASQEIFTIRQLLWQMIQEIITWMNTVSGGDPIFIINTGLYFSSTTDGLINGFVGEESDPALDGVCEPFKDEVKLGIGSQYQTFEKQIECEFEDPEQMQTFTSGDFTNGGGWGSWLSITTIPQNNQLGTMIIAQKELDRRIEEKKEEQTLEANWGDGFMSLKDCETNAASSDPDRNYDGCVTQTPGSVLANKMNWADTSAMRQLELADNFNSIFYIMGIEAGANKYFSDPNARQDSISTEGINSNQLVGSNIGSSYTEYITYINSQRQQTNPTPTISPNNFDGDSQPNSLDSDMDGDGIPNTTDPDDNQDGTNDAPGQYFCTINFSQLIGSGGSLNQNLANEMIACQITVELGNWGAQGNLLSLFNGTISAFEVSTCNQTVKNSTISQINGTYTGVSSLIWNKPQTTNDSNLSSNNINTLNAAQTALATSPTSPATLSLITSLASNPNFHTAYNVTEFSAGGIKYGQIQSWINGQVTAAESTSCNVNTGSLVNWGII